ncbi:transposase [Nocardia sp. R7R-8]|uniref:transposase n=1 Tax=Nocardia sp. R7R-8 TaxID=3459304 RepID=UPI00403D7CE2
MINAIRWKLRTGAPWRDLPERYGRWKTAHSAVRRRAFGLWGWSMARAVQNIIVVIICTLVWACSPGCPEAIRGRGPFRLGIGIIRSRVTFSHGMGSELPIYTPLREEGRAVGCRVKASAYLPMVLLGWGHRNGW